MLQITLIHNKNMKDVRYDSEPLLGHSSYIWTMPCTLPAHLWTTGYPVSREGFNVFHRKWIGACCSTWLAAFLCVSTLSSTKCPSKPLQLAQYQDPGTGLSKWHAVVINMINNSWLKYLQWHTGFRCGQEFESIDSSATAVFCPIKAQSDQHLTFLKQNQFI